MPAVERTVVTRASLAAVWPYLTDFTTVTQWDPNTPECRRVRGDGGVGTVYAITSVFRGRATQLEYTVEAIVARERFTLRGRNRTVTVVEDMRFAEEPAGGVRVTYRADFTFHRWARCATPFLRRALRGIADDAQRGMTRALDALVPPDAVPTTFAVRSAWKELVHYEEGERRMTFDAGWGVTPPVLYVPDAATWDHVVPHWLVGRRDEVVARLRAHSGHVLADTDTGYVAQR